MLNINPQDGKNTIYIICRDLSGCSHVRLRWNAMYYAGFGSMGYTPIVSLQPNFDPGLLATLKCLVYQRPINDQDLVILERYRAMQKRYGYKIVFELDDQIFPIEGHGIPEYNAAAQNFNKDLPHLKDNVAKALSMVDEVTTTTDYLRKQIRDIFGFNNVKVIENVVPRFMWSWPRKKHIESDLVKPKVLYTGSPCHYRNPVEPRKPSPQEPQGFPGITPLKGDWDNAWCDWVIKMVKEDKIDFTVMGGLPWFLNPIAGKIKIIDWADCNSYARIVQEQEADFQIAPLIENEFNKCKSSLRHIEACASGAIFLGTIFANSKDSPYEECHEKAKILDTASVEDIENRFNELCKKDNYNEILDWQYDFINKNGYWLESTRHANQWYEMIDGKPYENFI